LALAMALLLAGGAAATQLALSPPWLGLTLELRPGEAAPASPAPHRAVIAAARGPSAKIPVGASLVAVGGIALDETDLIEEPDYFDTYPEMAAFFGRQTELARALAAPTVQLKIRDEKGDSFYEVAPVRRPLASLPALYWFPLLSGLVAALLGLWVAVLRPSRSTRSSNNHTGAILFAALGLCIPVFTVPAAIYGTRELAFSGRIFRALSTVNHLGALSFGIFLVLLFLSFPRPLLSQKLRLIVPAIFVPWILADALRIAPNQSWGSRIPTMLEMVGAIVAAVVAWFAAKRDPAARATLRWFGVSVLLGASLFVFSTVGTSFLGGIPELPQGYAFGFFLLMFVGLAIGVRRHALFELNTWAYRILFGVLGATALVALDALLALFLPQNRLLASSASLLAVGLVYFPVRNWLWGRIVRQKTVDGDALFRDLLAVTFAATSGQTGEQWQALLRKTFDADTQVMRDEAPDESRDGVVLIDEGTALSVPALGDSHVISALYLRYPWKGRGLFGEEHRALVEAAWRFLGHALAARDSFARGAREERARIAADLHDDVGARLLTSLHDDNLTEARATVRTAIGEMRGIVNELVGKTQSLSTLEADLRHETFTRLEAAGLAVHWPIALKMLENTAEPEDDPQVSYQVSRHLTSMLREALSNVIRHARATRADVRWSQNEGQLVVAIGDDGCGIAAGEVPASTVGGNGLAGLRRRASLLGGSVTIRPRADGGEAGTIVEIVIPLAPARHRSEV
jgi:signal transduction histidine kinase